MTDFTATGPEHPAGLTDRIRREVVVQHEALAGNPVQRFNHLLVRRGSQSHADQRLRLAAREQRGPVRARKQSGAALDRPDGLHVAPVDPGAGLQDGGPDNVLLELLERVPHGRRVVLFARPLADVGAHRGHLLDPLLLFLHLVGRAKAVAAGLGDERLHRAVILGLFGRPGLPGSGSSQVGDGTDDGLHVLVAEHHCSQHGLLGQLVGFRFHHQYAIPRAGHDQIKMTVGKLRNARVEDVGAIRKADPRPCDRAHERRARERQGGGRADHCRDVGIVLEVGAQHRADDLELVAEPGRKQGANWSVDQPRRQGFLLRGPPFTLEEAAGDTAGCRHLFLIVDGQREEVRALANFPPRHGGA